MRLLRVLVGLLLLCNLSACRNGGGGDDSGGLSTNACSMLGLQSKIVNGTECSSDNSPVVMIVMRASNGDTYLCSGTMLTQTHVLTAAHCFFENITDAVIRAHGRSIPATHVAVHPGVSEQQTAIFNDVAILTLSSAANLPTLPLATSTQPRGGDTLGIFGYGVVEGTNEGSSSAGVLRSGEMEVDNVTNDHIFTKYNGDGSNTCFGDSGGPAIFEVNGHPAIVGITSTGIRQDCLSGDVSLFAYTESQSILNFIRQVVPSVGTI